MGHKAGEKAAQRKRNGEAYCKQRDRERFDALEEITAESEVLPEQADWQRFKELGWRYSPGWKAFFAPPK